MRTEYKKEVTISLSTLMSPLFMSAHLRAGAVSRTEDASGASGAAFGTPLKMRRVPQEAVHSLWSRLFCGPLKMHRVPQEPVLCTEYLSRTVEACFLHRMLPKMRRVPQETFLRTARIFRTIGGPLRYRMPDTEAGCHRSGAWHNPGQDRR